MPRSPLAQSPAGRLCSTCVSLFSPSRSTSVCFSYGYGNRYSTAEKPAFAAAPKRSRKSRSFHNIVRLAASLGMVGSSTLLLRRSRLEALGQSYRTAAQKARVAADGHECHAHLQVFARIRLYRGQDAARLAVFL